MNTEVMATGVDRRALLSTLWIFVLLNVIFRDLHEIVRPAFLEETMTRAANGVQITEGMLLIAGMMLEIMIVMVVLSRVLKYRVNRLANIFVGAASIALVLVVGRPQDLDDMLFAAVEVVALSIIIWLAWRWPRLEDGIPLLSE